MLKYPHIITVILFEKSVYLIYSDSNVQFRLKPTESETNRYIEM